MLAVFEIVNCEWLEACDEVFYILFFEILFFGFLALPLIKFLFQTYDCKENSSGTRVLRRADNIGRSAV